MKYLRTWLAAAHPKYLLWVKTLIDFVSSRCNILKAIRSCYLFRYTLITPSGGPPPPPRAGYCRASGPGPDPADLGLINQCSLLTMKDNLDNGVFCFKAKKM